MRAVGWSLLALLAALLLLRGRRGNQALPNKQRGFVFAPAVTGGRSRDPHFSNVVLLLHCDGIEGSTEFHDSSSSARAVSALGDVRISRTNGRFWFGGASASFDGGASSSADRLAVAHAANLVMDAADFTLECHVYQSETASGIKYLVSKSGKSGVSVNNYLLCLIDGAPAFRAGDTSTSGAGTTTTALDSGVTLTAGKWHHLAVSKEGLTFRLFIDGAMVASTVSAFHPSDPRAGQLFIGYEDAQPVGRNWAGLIDEVRITKGVARYAAAFVPPVAAFPDA